MASVIRFEITQKEIDENDDVLYSFDYVFTTEYTALQKSSFSVPSVNSYFTLPFGNVVTGKVLRFSSDQAVSILLNGATQAIPASESIIFFGEFSEIEVKNYSGEDASISFDLYGE